MDINNRRDFLQLAGMVEGGTLLFALGLGWLLDIDPWSNVSASAGAIAAGLLGTLPIFAVYGIARETRSVAVEMMGPLLSRCRWFDLIALAGLAGVGEELLFRGVLQPWLDDYAPWLGFVAANVMFGLVHFVTPTYALIATGIGMYLSIIAYNLPHANLLSAMIAHGVYDYVAFLLIIGDHRRSAGGEVPVEVDNEQGVEDCSIESAPIPDSGAER